MVLKAFDDFLAKPAEVDGLAFQVELARGDARDVQHVFDEVRHAVELSIRVGDAFGDGLSRNRLFVAPLELARRDLELQAHGGDGGAELVGADADELVAGTDRFLQGGFGPLSFRDVDRRRGVNLAALGVVREPRPHEHVESAAVASARDELDFAFPPRLELGDDAAGDRGIFAVVRGRSAEDFFQALVAPHLEVGAVGVDEASLGVHDVESVQAVLERVAQELELALRFAGRADVARERIDAVGSVNLDGNDGHLDEDSPAIAMERLELDAPVWYRLRSRGKKLLSLDAVSVAELRRHENVRHRRTDSLFG